MKRHLWIYALGGLTAALVAIYGYVHSYFFVYQDDVDALIAELPPDDAALPPLVRDIVSIVEGDRQLTFVSRTLLGKTHGTKLPMSEWHTVSLVWHTLLPLRLEDDDIQVLYAHFLPFEGGQGLSFGARHYFGKKPEQLTQDEVLSLLAISIAPTANSPTAAPDRFKRQVNLLRSVYLRSEARQRIP